MGWLWWPIELFTGSKDTIKDAWLAMLEPPWRHSGSDNGEGLVTHWIVWLVGWAWSLAGLVLGAVVAPRLVQYVGLANSPYQDELVITIAVTAGFLVQLLGWFLVIPFHTNCDCFGTLNHGTGPNSG